MGVCLVLVLFMCWMGYLGREIRVVGKIVMLVRRWEGIRRDSR